MRVGVTNSASVKPFPRFAQTATAIPADTRIDTVMSTLNPLIEPKGNTMSLDWALNAMRKTCTGQDGDFWGRHTFRSDLASTTIILANMLQALNQKVDWIASMMHQRTTD
jgi:hypothetical protein